jgi:fluoride exporter
MQVLIVFIGGGLGSVLRFLIGAGMRHVMPALPVATFIANVIACIVFAFVAGTLGQKYFSSPHIRLLLLTGFCGGLSTFSTFGYETFIMLKDGLLLYGILNILVSVAGCLLMFTLIK